MVKQPLALDTLGRKAALRLASHAAPFVQILEAGIPLIRSICIQIVTRLKIAHPDKIILADLKSSEVGTHEADIVLRAGAQIVAAQGITAQADPERAAADIADCTWEMWHD